MKKSPRLIIIPFNLPWDWSTDYTNQTAFELAKKNNFVICYMWSENYSLREYIRNKKFPRLIKRYSDRIHLFYPIQFLPFRRFKLITQMNNNINLYILKIYALISSFGKNIGKRIIWLFDPQLAPIVKYFNNGWFLIYDCVDYFPGAVVPEFKKTVEKRERFLLSKANLVVANSRVLVDYLKKYRNDVKLVPQGFRLDSFKKIIKDVKINRKDRPLIGYVGAINNRIDYELLYKLSKNNPDWDFALWGRVVEEQLFTGNQKRIYSKLICLPNVISGNSSKEMIPSVINEFDVGIIPYEPKLDFNKYCYPMKVFEYLYFGKHVVSTDIVELKRFPEFVDICQSVNSWEKTIKRNIKAPLPTSLKVKAKELAIDNSWTNKIKTVLNYIK